MYRHTNVCLLSSTSNQMILSKISSFYFEHPIYRVDKIFPSYNNTITLTLLKQNGEQYLAQYDQNGKLLYEYNLNNWVYTLCQVSQKQFILLKVEQNIIWMINIQTKFIQEYAHKFQFDSPCQCYLDYFCQTRLVCVRQHGDNDDSVINLTYYGFPFVPSQTKVNKQTNQSQQDSFDKERQLLQIEPYAELKSQCSWNPNHIIRKMNSKSKYIWCNQRHKQFLEIFQAQVINQQVKVNILRINLNSLYQPYGLSDMQLAIIEMWELRPGQLIFFTSTDKSGKTRKNPTQKVVNNTFVWDLQMRTIRQSYFSFEPQYQDLLIDIVGTPTFSMFRTFYFQAGQVLESPAYFIDNKEEKIIQTQKWKCSHIQKYIVPDYKNDTIIQASYQNQNVKEMTVRTIKKLQKFDLSLFLLLNIEGQGKNDYEDWDEDLLLDVIKFLDYCS